VCVFSKYSKSEDEKLVELAQKHKGYNWVTIAQELGVCTILTVALSIVIIFILLFFGFFYVKFLELFCFIVFEKKTAQNCAYSIMSVEEKATPTQSAETGEKMKKSGTKS